MNGKHTLPADIERTSMAIITQELAAAGIELPPQHAAVVKRVIHTTADFDYAQSLRFTPDAVARGVAALRQGVPIVTDTNMAKAWRSLHRSLRRRALSCRRSMPPW